ncbi:MAG TPA: carboxypeptidase regulatory-like domain-containing protein [Blastocatellia bacterium]|nr:carboxypeptidase regulatory-like domain-containing protein [Blastocatellia bacterium]
MQPTKSAARPGVDYTDLPLSFEANIGQSDSRVRFISRNGGYNLFLTQSEAVLSITPHQRAESTKEQTLQPSVIRIKPEGANSRSFIEGLDRLEAKSNYLIGRDSAQWRSNIPQYARVSYRSVYPGIDLVYYGNQRQIEYDFILSPGADASRIRLAIGGARRITIDTNGDLIIDTPSGLIRQLAPKAYQDIDGMRRKVASRYVFVGKHKVGFALGKYDRSRQLVIDPVLSYATMMGGTGTGGDWGNSVAVDPDGNIYVAGYTTSTDFPTTPGALKRTFGGGDTFPLYDAFVTKINPSGSGVVYSTYLGGGGSDVAYAIKVDSSGNAYVSGSTTSTNFPVSAGAYQSVCRGRADAFVVKLDPAGAALIYSTYLGGISTEFGGGLAIDGDGNAYVAGRTYSNNFPVTAGAFQTSLNLGLFCNECEDGYVTKLNPAGTGLVYSTFLGGSNNDMLTGLALGADSSVYLTGSTVSTNFPATAGAFQTTRSGGEFTEDVFVTRLSPGGNSAIFSTYLGSTETDRGYAVAVDVSGNAYVTGITNSPNFPTTPGAYQTSVSGAVPNNVHGFVSKLNTTGTGLVYSTFLGGEKEEEARGIAVDAAGNAVVVGATTSSSFPTSADAFQKSSGGYRDAFVTQLNNSGTQVLYSSFIGDAGWDGAAAVTIDAQGRASVTGGTYSAQFPVTQGNPWNARPGESDMFVVRINLNESGYRISGRVTNDLGNPLLEVAVSVTGSLTHTVYTDSNGFYSIGGLPAGANLTLSANRDSTTYSPANVNISNLSQDETVDFSGPSPLIITGKIVDNQGVGVVASVELSGSLNNTTQSDLDGRYYFRNLPAGGNYTVTPTSFLYTITPASASVENLDGDKVLDFTGTLPPSIEGRITDEFGFGISNVTVNLSGTHSMSVMTDFSGYYRFPFLPTGGNYTVTPFFFTGITFSPASQTVENLTSDQTFNFTLLFPLRLSGRVTDEYGNGVSSVGISLTGTMSASTSTDWNGFYSFFELPRGGDYTVTPSSALYNFTPPIATITNMGADETRDFSATIRQLTISGQVYNIFGGTVAGVTMTLSGSQSATTETDSNGAYSFTGLPGGGMYTVVAAKPGYSFNPSSADFGPLNENATADFFGLLNRYNISGHMMDSGGVAMSGVSVILSGPSTPDQTSLTDANGRYSFSGLAAAEAYTVTPSLTHYTFSPASQSFTSLSEDQTADFTGTRLTYSISGRVTDSASAGQAGVTVTLAGGSSATTQTDAAGNYSFAAVPSGHNYTVTAAKTHYSITPTSRSFDDLSGNQTADFTATLLRHDVAGRILDSGGNSMAGVSVTLSGSQSGTAITDANGNYSFASLPAGGNYNVAPTAQFYLFSPASLSFNDLSGNQAANFTGTRRTYSITGRVAEGATGVGGVTIGLAGGQSSTVLTDAAGNFVFNGVPAGFNYTVTPTHPFFGFSPASYTFTTLSQNHTANFSAVRWTYQVSGFVKDACSQAISGVTMTLSHDGINLSAQTNASGFYQFIGVQAGFDYTLTPSKTGHSFNPGLIGFAGLNANQTANFTGTPPASTSTVHPTADAYVRAGSSANSNFGTTTQLITRLASSSNNTHETYLTFNVGQVCTVSNVKLRLFGKLSSSGNLSVSAHAVSNTTWTETGITWNNRPATGSALTTRVVTGTTNTWYEWDITQYVRSEISAGRRTISIALKGVMVTSNQATFNSRQAATNRPELVITKP